MGTSIVSLSPVAPSMLLITFCGTVGLRPTAGTVARIQRQAYSPLSVEGPMGRTVADVALMLDCQAGELGADPLSRPAPARTFLSAACAPALPARIAFSTDLGIAPNGQAFIAFQQRVAFKFFLDKGRDFHIGRLQQLDRLAQLRRHHQLLRLPQIETRADRHQRCSQSLAERKAGNMQRQYPITG